ncbi:MAG: threonylcarbamoyl-AMP synthase [Euryarchaeota archaeon]|nr:threonylcarbamoyl-AMP synthase [Euryarchaeota archaeon]
MKILKCERKRSVCSELARCRRPEVVEAAVEVIKEGGLLVYPTDTLYGLGADALNPEAIGKVFEAKERPFDAPISIAVSDVDMMRQVATLSPWTSKVVEALIPRPITFLLPRKRRVPGTLTGGSDVLGVRIPNHMFALSVIARTGPITTTSANLHEGHSPRTARSAIRQLGDAVDLYVDCGRTAFGRASTVVDLTAASPRKVAISRRGAADRAEVLRVIGRTR